MGGVESLGKSKITSILKKLKLISMANCLIS